MGPHGSPISTQNPTHLRVGSGWVLGFAGFGDVYAQLRTGHARLNTFLYQIGKIASNECECLEMPETVEHFIFHCKIWEDLRAEMKTEMGQRYGDLSYALGGRSSQSSANGQPVDQERGWVPNIKAVKAVTQFTIKTGRFDKD